MQAAFCAGIALHRLAQAHERRGDAEQAAYYYEMNLHRMDAEQVAGSEAVDALMFLAAYHKVTVLRARSHGRRPEPVCSPPCACRDCFADSLGGFGVLAQHY